MACDGKRATAEPRGKTHVAETVRKNKFAVDAEGFREIIEPFDHEFRQHFAYSVRQPSQRKKSGCARKILHFTNVEAIARRHVVRAFLDDDLFAQHHANCDRAMVHCGSPRLLFRMPTETFAISSPPGRHPR